MDMFEKDWGEKIKSDDDTQPENGGATEGVDARLYCTDTGLHLTFGYMDFAIQMMKQWNARSTIICGRMEQV